MRLPLLFAFVTVQISALALNAASASEHPNVIVILADDQGWGHLSLHGNQNLDTPALEFIAAQQKQDRASFTYLALPTPHSPIQATDEDWARFEGKKLTSLATAPAREVPQHTRAALAMVENIDQHVARILARIRELDIEDNTIVVYFSDNGPNGDRYNGNMRGKKGSTDEGGVRSPLFIRYPGAIQPATTIETIASSIDLLPTLVRLANLPHTPQQPLDGISLAPVLQGSPNWQAPQRLLYSYWNGQVSARSQDYRLDSAGRLYHFPSDRQQHRDLSQQKPDLTAALSAAVANWKEALLTPENIDHKSPQSRLPRTRHHPTPCPRRPMERDRVDRTINGESYVRDFASLELGQISLAQGIQQLHLQSNQLPSDTLLEFRILTLEAQ